MDTPQKDHKKLFKLFKMFTKQDEKIENLFFAENFFTDFLIYILEADQAVQWLGKPAAAPKVPGSYPG